MTTSVSENVRSRSSRRDPQTETPPLARLILDRLRAQRKVEAELVWPCAKYRHDIVGYFEDILGVIPWSRQRDLLHAVQTYDRNACKSGRRVSKSLNAGGIALWWYGCEPFARAVMSSTTARQVDAILWRELTMLRARSGRCISCLVDDPLGRGPKPCRHSALIDGEIGLLARTGLKSVDEYFREVFGFTAREAEAVQGIAGPALFFLLDESSGIPDAIFDAVEGNLAGGGHSLYLGNPTKTSGPFFDAFNKNKLDPKNPKAGGVNVLTISSYESPNVSEVAREDLAQRFDRMARETTRDTAIVAAQERARGIRSHTLDVTGRPSEDAVRGLANAEWIRVREREWGKDSPLFRVHVLGEFATNEDGKIFSIERIEAAKARMSETVDGGELWIGIDPAGETGTGDESCFAPRRGLKQLEILATRGLNADGHLVELRGLIVKYRIGREVPYVVVDRSGSIGATLHGTLAAVADGQRGRGEIPEFEVIGVMPSARAQRQPNIYDTVRDELAANLEAKFRDGVAIVDDVKLDKELHELEWKQRVDGRVKVTPKDELKKALGRSPDRYDATALSWWEPLHIRAPEVAAKTPTPEAAPPRSEQRFDPFAGRNRWRR